MTVLDIDATGYARDYTGRLREIVNRLLAYHGIDPRKSFRVEMDERGAYVSTFIKQTERHVFVFWDHGTDCCDNSWGSALVYMHRWYPHPGARATG